MGIHPGQRLADAMACVPDLSSHSADRHADADALERLALWCQKFGARTGMIEPHAVWIDISGTEHLFGDEAGLLRRLSGALRSLGGRACIGVAGTLVAARAMAFKSLFLSQGALSDGELRLQRGCTLAVCPAGHEDEALRSIGVEGLWLSDAATQSLRALGLKTIGDLMAIDRKELYLRMRGGAKKGTSRSKVGAGVRWTAGGDDDPLIVLDRALGRRREELVSLSCRPAFFRQKTFFHPLITAQSLETGVAFVLKRLCADLESASRSCNQYRVTFYRTDQSVFVQDVRTTLPVSEPGHLLSLLHERMAAADLGLGVETIRVEAMGDAVQAKVSQQSDFSSRDRQRAVRAEVLDRLIERVGAINVFTLARGRSHMPELRQEEKPVGMQSSLDPGGAVKGGLAAPPSATGAATGACAKRAKSARRTPDAVPSLPLAERPALILPRPEPLGGWVGTRARAKSNILASGAGPAPVEPCATATHDPLECLEERMIDHSLAYELAELTWRGRARKVVCQEGPETFAVSWWAQVGVAAADADIGAHVRDEGATDGRPDAFRAREDDESVMSSTAPAWHNEARRYYKVETDDGLRLWLYAVPPPDDLQGKDHHEQPQQRWFVHGVFA